MGIDEYVFYASKVTPVRLEWPKQGVSHPWWDGGTMPVIALCISVVSKAAKLGA